MKKFRKPKSRKPKSRKPKSRRSSGKRRTFRKNCMKKCRRTCKQRGGIDPKNGMGMGEGAGHENPPPPPPPNGMPELVVQQYTGHVNRAAAAAAKHKLGEKRKDLQARREAKKGSGASGGQ